MICASKIKIHFRLVALIRMLGNLQVPFIEERRSDTFFLPDYYNRIRLPSGLGCKSPPEFERDLKIRGETVFVLKNLTNSQCGGSWRERAANCSSAFRVGDIARNSDIIVG